jgi:hypothetical protein
MPAFPTLWTTTRTNVPHLHHVSSNIRSPRTTLQDLFMESIHVIQHSHRITLGRHLGSSVVFDMVLSHWILSECRTYRYGPRAGWINVSFRARVPIVHCNVWVHVRDMFRNCRDSWECRKFIVHLLSNLLRVSPVSSINAVQ